MSKTVSNQPPASGSPSKWWTHPAVLAVIGVVLVSLIYIMIFAPKWREVPLKPHELDGYKVRVVSQTGPTTPRDFYSLPCNGWITFRRFLSSYTKDPKSVGEIYALVDGGGWLPVKEWHEAAKLLYDAKKRGDSTLGSDKLPYRLADPALWPPFLFFQASDGPGSIVVSQVGLDGIPMEASQLSIKKLSCE